MKSWLCLLFLVASPAAAQGAPDARVRLVDYQPDAVVSAQVAPNHQLTIVFAEAERIENVAIGDSNGWRIAQSERGNQLFVKPVQDRSSTNMTVVTSDRTYLFELSPDRGGYAEPVFTLRFRYAEADAAPGPTATAGPPVPSGYLLSGARSLRPSAIHDDGVHTYLEWPADASLPAVFGIDEAGEEMLVDGYMRNGVYTIDRVYGRLVFRIDKLAAQARREAAPGS